MIFVTELIVDKDGTCWGGPHIEADSWEEAEKSCVDISAKLEHHTCKVVGEYMGEVPYTNGEEERMHG